MEELSLVDISQIYLPGILAEDKMTIRLSNKLIQMECQDISIYARLVRSYIFNYVYKKARKFIDEYGIEQWQLASANKICEHVIDFTDFFNIPDIKNRFKRDKHEKLINSALDELLNNSIQLHFKNSNGTRREPVTLVIINEHERYGVNSWKIIFSRTFIECFIPELHITENGDVAGSHYLPMGQTLKFRSKSAERLYSFLVGTLQTSQFTESSNFSFSVDADFMRTLMVGNAENSSYKVMSLFKKKVFEPAVEEVKLLSPIKFTATFTKTGPVYDNIIFSNFNISGIDINQELFDEEERKKKNARDEEERKKKEFISMAAEDGFSPAQIIDLMDKASPKYIDSYKKAKNMYVVYMTLGDVSEDEKFNFFYKQLCEME